MPILQRLTSNAALKLQWPGEFGFVFGIDWPESRRTHYFIK